MIKLRPYQTEAVEAVEAAWVRGVRRPLVAAPTGCGKTLILAELIRRIARRALLLAHREELLHQAAEKIRMVIPGADIGLVRAESDEHGANIVVASTQTLARPERLRRVGNDFGVVVADECHHYGGDGVWRRILGAFGATPMAGFTATPERSDKQRLEDVWDEIVYRRTLPEMIRAGYLCDLRAVRVGLTVDLARVRTRDGDFSEADLERELEAADAPRHVVDAYQRHAEGRKALLFTAGVHLAHEMAEALEAAGVPAAAVDGSTPREERAQLLRAFHAGDIRVLANCGVLTEGYDEPSTECLMLVRPTKSRVLYAQMVGRGTRRHPGKQDCLIVDLVGNSERHDLASIGSLFGFEPPEGESVIEAMDAHGRSAVDPSDVYAPQQADDGELVARTVELFDARRFSWACGDGLFVLPAGDAGQVAVQEVQDGWRVWQLGRDGQQLLADGLDLDYAQGTAEDMVRRLGGAGLAKRDATWRSNPASEGQLQALQRMGMPIESELTRGDASNLMTLEIARRALEPATEKQRRALQRRGFEMPGELT
ncbi:MAG: DEAD/DEAH box helicase, partial [Candidatus Dormibacteraeota bacterium]|nr:DEAD/DEAH box helicase [Candidatus Dormibacteraeota bacterium]